MEIFDFLHANCRMQFTKYQPHLTGKEEVLAYRNGFHTNGTIEVRSPAFTAGEDLPARYTADGENISPPVIWHHIPSHTRELVLICEDSNSRGEEPFVHWLLYGIPPEVRQLPENFDAVKHAAPLNSIGVGLNSGNTPGYTGPFISEHYCPHYYHFQLFALKQTLNLPAGLARSDVVESMEGNILAEGTFIGIYG